MFWVRSDLDSGKKIRVFNFWGVCSGTEFQNSGVLEFGQKISGNLAWKPSLLVHHR